MLNSGNIQACIVVSNWTMETENYIDSNMHIVLDVCDDFKEKTKKLYFLMLVAYFEGEFNKLNLF